MKRDKYLPSFCYFLITIAIISLSSCEKSDYEPEMPDYEQPDSSGEHEDEAESPSEVGYIVGDLRYQLANGTKDECYVIGMAKYGIINHITIPNTISIDGYEYRVTSIGRDANITAYSVETQANMNTINSHAFSSDLQQLIVGTNVKKVSPDAWNTADGPFQTGTVTIQDGNGNTTGRYDYTILSNYTPKKVSKVIWLPNTQPQGVDFRLGGKVNYVSEKYSNLLFTEVETVSELSSLFWVDGILYTLKSPAERTCIAIGCDYNKNLDDLELQSEVTYQGITLKIINYGNYCFANNKKIKRVSTGEMTEVSEGTFMYCENTQKIVFGKEMEKIGENSFYGCFLIPTIELGSKVSRIEHNSFKECTSIREFIVHADDNYHETLKVYDSPLFPDCSLSSVVLHRNVEYSWGESNSNLFQSISSLTSVKMIEFCTNVYDNEFKNCNNLENVELGDNILSIGKFAFSGCPKMESFTVGKSITRINDNAFSDCTGLINFTTEALNPPYCGSQALQDIDKWKCTLHVPDESIDIYKSANQWKDFLFIE